ncbi:MAG: glycosyltransferase family 2 protein [Clostridia bacterium]|nr:glycosyltransferase family 2 protein [Clostridia bacterium]
MPKVSVIVPVYNVEKYLHACLDSILAQTFTDFELILVDDGSPDSSGKICDEYADKDSRIRVFHQENQGQAAARNFGVNQSATEWIHFVDSDDIIHPQTLEILFEAVKKHNVKLSLALVSESVTNENLSGVFSYNINYSSQVVDVSEDTLIEYFNDTRYHSVCAKLISKDILMKYPFQIGRIHEDSPVICKWLVEAKKIAYSPNMFYVYIANNNSTTRSTFSLKKLDLLWAWEQQIDFYKSIGFKRMQRLLEFRFISSAGRFYKIIKESTDINSDLAKKLKRYTFKNYFHALFNKQIPINDRLFALEYFYPRTIMVFWLVRNRINKILKKRS